MKYSIKCHKCGNTQDYEPRVPVKNKTHTACKSCGITIYIYNQIQEEIKKQIITKGDKKPKSIPPQNTTIDENWFEMEDPELARHTYREVLTNNNSTVRERLEAASKLVDLKYKSGTLDVKNESEKEVMNKFKQQDTQTLVNILKKSSQSEPS